MEVCSDCGNFLRTVFLVYSLTSIPCHIKSRSKNGRSLLVARFQGTCCLNIFDWKDVASPLGSGGRWLASQAPWEVPSLRVNEPLGVVDVCEILKFVAENPRIPF